MKATFVNVGYGDCILLQNENGYISLIDGHNFISHIRRFYQPVGYIRIYLLRHFVFQRQVFHPSVVCFFEVNIYVQRVSPAFVEQCFPFLFIHLYFLSGQHHLFPFMRINAGNITFRLFIDFEIERCYVAWNYQIVIIGRYGNLRLL